jgi:hypothetical protein
MGHSNKLLALYLLLTGAISAVVLLAPSLVVLGFYLFILPGLILSLMPTAFLWGCVFAAAWYATKSFLGDTALAALLAAALSALTLFAVTQPFRAAGQALYAETLLPDVTPPFRIPMSGDVRIELPAPRWDNLNPRGPNKLRGFACDNLCVALLFTPGVDSVTINRTTPLLPGQRRKGAPAFDREAQTYRLVPPSACPQGGLRPDLQGRNGLFPAPGEEGRALLAEWQARLALQHCLQRSAPLEQQDILIRHRREFAPSRFAKYWGLPPQISAMESVELQNATGEVLLRRLEVSVAMPSPWLTISFTGGPGSMRAGWGRTVLTNKSAASPLSLLKELEQHTNTRGR